MGGVTSVLSLKKELNKEGNDIDVYLLYNLGFENWEKVYQTKYTEVM
jgi:predicted aldo/keto reductase-like oxidoreductase